MKPSLRKLFLTNLYLSAFTFGGGYVIITLMKKEFVDRFHWIDEQEMLDLVAIAQSCPGPIAVNGAIVVGFQMAGIQGLLISVLATVLPPFVILSLISLCYTAFRSNDYVGWMLNGMQSGVAAVIAQVVVEMTGGLVRDRRWLSILVLCAAFLASYVLEVNAALIILAAAVFGLLTRNLNHKKDHQTDQTKKEETS
ncbi:MAG: chromate transporter [Lachnospiraceae bacterium]|uniref:Chromate transporter n=1 Tax=Candidatus Enterocloster excrementigallinarum TaxID=2838558 RepID=A0A9D2PSY1_9FIRM|nr:chromate transporter [Lachnospiraceae bacterium]HJC65495.1 chromate transporter [Candidatus Enterocloster excrementigallinarum]